MNNNYNDEETKEFEPFKEENDSDDEVEITDYSDEFEDEDDDTEESEQNVDEKSEKDEDNSEESDDLEEDEEEEIAEEKKADTVNNDEDDKLKKEKKNIIIICLISGLTIIIMTLIFLVFIKGCGKKDNKPDNNSSDNVTSNSVVATITIIFDANGGNPVDSMKIDENTSITLPTTTRTGYTFDGWYLDDTKVDDSTTYDSDTVLVAKWLKEEYTCPDGYKLDGKKCTLTKDATASCPSGTKENGTSCVSLTDYKKADKKCPKKTIDGTSYDGVLSEDEDGTIVCWYAPVTSLTTDEACNGQGNVWYNDKCFEESVTNSDDITVSCAKEYDYISMDDLKKKFNVSNMIDGCYKKVAKTYSCEKDFTLSSNKCTKTIDATIKEQ